MEIERKYLITRLPAGLEAFPCDHISQAYISRNPVIRLRKKNQEYILTVKSSGLLAREESELPLEESSYRHLMGKTEGMVIEKDRFRIPDPSSHGRLTIELDIFKGTYEGLMVAEVEFPSVREATSYTPPEWFGREVTEDPSFYNSTLSSRSNEEAAQFISNIKM